MLRRERAHGSHAVVVLCFISKVLGGTFEYALDLASYLRNDKRLGGILLSSEPSVPGGKGRGGRCETAVTAYWRLHPSCSSVIIPSSRGNMASVAIPEPAQGPSVALGDDRSARSGQGSFCSLTPVLLLI